MNRQPQETGSGSGREIAMLVGVLLLVATATIGTYWVRSQSAEASSQPGSAPAPAPTPVPHPRVAAPTSPEGDVVHADIYFDFKSTRLRADAVKLLQAQAEKLDHASTWGVLVQGFADRQGPPEYNRSLAQRRAEAVKQFLVELGVPEPSIKVVTIGQEGALCDDASTECRQLNRRVHLEIRKLTKAAALEPLRPRLMVGDTLETQSGWRQQP
ncbi:MAG TPA: OmpA family protein [Methylomirabilota bacterium]|jgi:outer membrane protein OmpA-like peptidoglycan-associated protein|nr:OmpA family protein [Methylomirabilota bacterium]